MRALLLITLGAAWLLVGGCGQPTLRSSPPSLQESSEATVAYPSNELLSIHQYLEAKGKSWRFFYDEVSGERYQWLISRSVYDTGIHYHFVVGREIDSSGAVIGADCPYSDQLFSIRLDPNTAEVQEIYGIGG